MGFTKLFSSIVTSSLWTEDDKTLRVWVAMLATCNAQGVVEGSIPGFASLCRIEISDMERALSILEGPDQYSRTKAHEGRRVAPVAGGWQILNYSEYREKGQAKKGSRAEYMRQYREEHPKPQPVTRNTQTVTRNTEAEAEAEENKNIVASATPSLVALDAKKPRKAKTKVRLTDLRPESQEAFEAVWDERLRKVMRWDDRTRAWVEAEVNAGSRAQAERNFQNIADSGLATPRELYACWHLYIGQAKDKGFVQMVSTFYGPEKATWREYLEPARIAIHQQDSEVA